MPLKLRELERILKDFNYVLDHQKWSHQTYSCWVYMLTIPKHQELKPWTAKSILDDICKHQSMSIQSIKEKYNIKL